LNCCFELTSASEYLRFVIATGSKNYGLPKFTTGVDSDMWRLQGNLCVEYFLPQRNIIQGQGNTYQSAANM